MRRQRLTRDESKVQTRARLLEAAAAVFTEKGFHGASVEEIAERAGYTRGGFYSNFVDKAEVVLALLDEHTSAGVTEVTTLLSDATSPAEAFARLSKRREESVRDPSWLMLSTEFWLYAMRNPEVRPRLAERERELRDAYASAIEALFTSLGLAAPAPVRDLAVIVQVLDEGIPARRHMDPNGIAEDFEIEALATLLEAGVALARAQLAEQSSEHLLAPQNPGCLR